LSATPTASYRTFFQHGLIGAVIGILVLHPLTKAVYWFEFKDSLATVDDNLWPFLMHRFELFINNLVESRLSGDLCVLVHCSFHVIDDKDVARIVIEPSELPVYLQDGNTARYFLRTGNATRELDAREAHAHIVRH